MGYKKSRKQKKQLDRLGYITDIIKDLHKKGAKVNYLDTITEQLDNEYGIDMTRGQIAGLLRRNGLDIGKVRGNYKEFTSDEITDTLNLKKYKPVEYHITMPKNIVKANKHKILCIGDLQAGARKNGEEYVPMPFDLLRHRMDLLKSEFESSFKDDPFEHLTIFLLGDLVDGELIYPNQDVVPVGIQVGETQQMIYDVIKFVGAFVKDVTIYGVAGNHGNLPRWFQKETNWDRMIMKNIAQFFDIEHSLGASEHITFNYDPDTLQRPKIEGWEFLIHHGDAEAFPKAFNMEGWLKHISNWKAWLYKDMDCVVLGHWHKYHMGETHEVQLFVNGTLYDSPFVQRKLGKRESIGFLLLTIGDSKPVKHVEILDLRD